MQLEQTFVHWFWDIYTGTIFECGSGERVSILAKCNGIPECLDMSDESECPEFDASK